MSFYGNITNSSRTQFQFDRKFPNRATMDNGVVNDGVFIGRFVLVEYGIDSFDSYPLIYKKEDGFYRSAEAKSPLLLYVENSGDEENTAIKGKIYRVEQGFNELWQCIDADEKGFAQFKALSADESEYVQNQAIDFEVYGVSRGYDSTVWQKVYDAGAEKYVMVAELNTMTPTFDIAIDAPTLTPTNPHFDLNSNNTYYKIHLQPSWGFRLKSADNNLTIPEISMDGQIIKGTTTKASSAIEKEYPSDLTTEWTKTFYDSSTGEESLQKLRYHSDGVSEWVDADKDINPVPAAVYFNKAGFSSDTVSYSADNDYVGWNAGDNDSGKGKISDTIEITPTGKSGIRYAKHDGTNAKESRPDAQELAIMLPSLGDTLAEMWDIVYGGREAIEEYYEGDVDEDLESTRIKDMGWLAAEGVHSQDGLRLHQRNSAGLYNYNKSAVDSMVGAINSVHDLMGRIIVEQVSEDEEGKTFEWETNATKLQSQIDSLNDEYIYFKDGRYYMKDTRYEYTPLTGEDPYYYKEASVSENTWKLNTYYTKENSGYVLQSEYTEGVQYYVRDFVSYQAVSLAGDKPQVSYTTNDVYFKDSDSSSTPGFILDDKYYSDRTYYKYNEKALAEVELSTGYEPNKFYIKTEEELRSGSYITWTLSASETSSSRLTYYTIEDKDVEVANFEALKSAGLKNPADAPYYYEKHDDKFYSYNGTYDPDKIYYQRIFPYYPGRYYYAVYTEAEVTEDNYAPNKYYLVHDGEAEILTGTLCTDEVYNPERIYYTRGFVKDNGLEKPSLPGADYFVLNNLSLDIDSDEVSYVQETVYIKVDIDENNYIADVYYIADGKEKKLATGSYEELLTKDEEGNIIKPVFYQRKVYLRPVYKENEVDVNNPIPVKLMWDIDLYEKESVKNSKKYNYIQANYYNYETLLKAMKIEAGTALQVLYKFKAGKPSDVGSIYEPNKFYYRYGYKRGADGSLVEDSSVNDVFRKGSFVLDMGQYDANKIYYTPANILNKVFKTSVSLKYYEPSTYYYLNDNGNYVLSTSETSVAGRQYYTQEGLYVTNENNIGYSIGAQWRAIGNPDSSIVLGTRKVVYKLKELPEFGYSFNTIHGLILKLHQLLKDGDTTTRDPYTVQGVINNVNDLVKNMYNLEPRSLVVVDDYGRLTNGILDDEKAWIQEDPVDNIDKITSWIDVDVHFKENDETPYVALAHKYTPLNAGEDEIYNVSDHFTVPLLDFDKTGHMIRSQKKTINIGYMKTDNNQFQNLQTMGERIEILEEKVSILEQQNEQITNILLKVFNNGEEPLSGSGSASGTITPTT